MLSPLRNRFGIPGVISVIALVFAMLGGAYAASDNGGSGKPKASASAKKGPRGPRGPKGPAGPPGPAGTAGAQGPAGAKGDKGDTGSAGTNGSNGTNGTNGTSATVASFAGSKGTCTEGQGGLEVKSASPTAFVCNGKNGTTGFTETLPSGKTETGAWLMQDEGEVSMTSISFPIPLPAPMSASENVRFMNVGEGAKAGCTGGTAAAPKADPGFLCVYLSRGSGEFIAGSAGTGEATEIGTTGALLFGVEITPEGVLPYVGGTWAVTAP